MIFFPQIIVKSLGRSRKGLNLNFKKSHDFFGKKLTILFLFSGKPKFWIPNQLQQKF